MRTWRLSLAATVIVVLLGGVSASVAAEDADPDLTLPHGVTGEFVFTLPYTRYTLTDDALGHRDDGWEATSTFDDLRLSGDAWLLFNTDTLLPRPYSKIRTGTMRIENPGGAWVGTFQGYYDPAVRRETAVYELTGIDGYEGYSALLVSQDSYEYTSVEGFVFPGALPEYPDSVEVPAQ